MNYDFIPLGCPLVFSKPLCSRYLIKIHYLKIQIFFKFGKKNQCNVYKHTCKIGGYVYIYLVYLTQECIGICGCVCMDVFFLSDG